MLAVENRQEDDNDDADNSGDALDARRHQILYVNVHSTAS